MKQRRRKKLVLSIAKIAFSIFLILYVLGELDFNKIEKLLYKADYRYFAVAVLMIIISQTFGALRMRYYFKKTELLITRTYSIGLYLIGRFWYLL